MTRRYPIGAEPQPDATTHFRVWAPRREKVEVLLDNSATLLTREPDGHHSGLAPAHWTAHSTAFASTAATPSPTPPRRFQPRRPARPVAGRRPRPLPLDRPGLEGRRAARARSSTRCTSAPSPARAPGTPPAASCRSSPTLGITVVELMPVADFPGRSAGATTASACSRRSRSTARPTTSAASSTRRTALGLGVILDVVYNHVGPDGNYLKQFSDDYFTDRYKNEWGEAINFDGENCRAGARVGHHQRRVLGRGVSPRRPAPGRHAADLRRIAGEHP